MKVNVDKRLCVLTGNCVMSAERVFRFEEGELEYDANPPEDERPGVEEAELVCPVQAISVED